MNRRGLILAAASAAAATRGAAQQSAAVPLGNTAPGQLPPGFRVALTGRGTAPAWAVVDDASVPAGSDWLPSGERPTRGPRFYVSSYDCSWGLNSRSA